MNQIASWTFASVMKTQSCSAKPDCVRTRTGFQPSIHSASRTGQSSEKTFAIEPLRRCLYVCVTRLGARTFMDLGASFGFVSGISGAWKHTPFVAHMSKPVAQSGRRGDARLAILGAA